MVTAPETGKPTPDIRAAATAAIPSLAPYAIEPAALAKTMGRLGDGAAASVIGAIVDLLSERQPAEPMKSSS